MEIHPELLDDYFSRSRDFVSFTGAIADHDYRYYPLVHNNRFVVIQGPGIQDMRDIRQGLEIIQSQLHKISFDRDGPSYYFMAEVAKGRWKIICERKTKARFKIKPECMPFATKVHERDINITSFTWTDLRFGEWNGKQVECYFSWNDYNRAFVFRNIQGHRLADHLGVTYPILAHIIDDDGDVIGEITERKEGRLVEFGDWGLVKDACQKLIDHGLLLEGPLPDNVMLTRNNEVRFLRVHNIIRLPTDPSERETMISRMWYCLRVNVFEKIVRGNPLPMPGEGLLIPRLLFPNQDPQKLMSGTAKMLIRFGVVLNHQDKFVRARQDACQRRICHLPEHFPWCGVKTKWNKCSTSDVSDREREDAGTHQIVMSYDGPNANLPTSRKRKHAQVDVTQEVRENTVQTSYVGLGLPRYILENLVLQRIEEELLPDRVKRKSRRCRNLEDDTSNSAQVPTNGKNRMIEGPKCSQPPAAPVQDSHSGIATIPNSSHSGSSGNAYVPRLLEVSPPKRLDSGKSRSDSSRRAINDGLATTSYFADYDRNLPVPDMYLGRPKTPSTVAVSVQSAYAPFKHNQIVGVGYEHRQSLTEGSSDARGNTGYNVKKRKLDHTLPPEDSSKEDHVRRHHRHRTESVQLGQHSKGLCTRGEAKVPAASGKGGHSEPGATYIAAEPYPGYVPAIRTYLVGHHPSHWEEPSGSRIEEVENEADRY